MLVVALVWKIERLMQDDSDLGDNWQDPKLLSCCEELNAEGKLN